MIIKWLIEHKESGLCISKDRGLEKAVDYHELINFDDKRDAQRFINTLKFNKTYFVSEHKY